jgi:hypothetical protein
VRIRSAAEGKGTLGNEKRSYDTDRFYLKDMMYGIVLCT